MTTIIENEELTNGKRKRCLTFHDKFYHKILTIIDMTMKHSNYTLDKGNDTLLNVYDFLKNIIIEWELDYKYKVMNIFPPTSFGANSLSFSAKLSNNNFIFIKMTIISDEYDIDTYNYLSECNLAPKLIFHKKIQIAENYNPYILITKMQTNPIKSYNIIDYPLTHKSTQSIIISMFLKLYNISYNITVYGRNISHNDLKMDNMFIVLNNLKQPIISFIDWENSTLITNNKIKKSFSSDNLIPPIYMQLDYASNGLGQRCIDAWSIVCVIMHIFYNRAGWNYGKNEDLNKINAYLSIPTKQKFLNLGIEDTIFNTNVYNIIHLLLYGAKIGKDNMKLKFQELIEVLVEQFNLEE